MQLTEALLVLLYILGSILLIVLIILGVKLINTMNKIDLVVDDINKKVTSLNGLFTMIDATTDKLSLLSDRLVDGVTLLVKKIFKPKNRKEEDINE